MQTKNCKRCTECGQQKPLEEFNRNHRMKDGHINQCKECTRPRHVEWNRQHPEVLGAANKRYRKRNPKAVRKWNEKTKRVQRERNPAHVKARKAVDNAVQRGALVKPSACEDCGGDFPKRDIHGHHEDYSKPLEVIWVCDSCHKKRHGKDRPDGG